MKVVYCDLHSPLFLAGKNFGTKLNPDQVSGLEMVFDKEFQAVIVKYNKKECLIPLANVASLQFVQPVIETLKSAEKFDGKRINAQASGPTDHVFAQASGKVRD